MQEEHRSRGAHPYRVSFPFTKPWPSSLGSLQHTQPLTPNMLWHQVQVLQASAVCSAWDRCTLTCTFLGQWTCDNEHVMKAECLRSHLISWHAGCHTAYGWATWAPWAISCTASWDATRIWQTTASEGPDLLVGRTFNSKELNYRRSGLLG